MAAGNASTGLLLDLDGVLRLWDAQYVAHVERDHGLAPGSVHRAAFAPERLLPAITGRVTDEAWRGSVAARLAGEYGDDAARAAVAAWSLPHGRVDDAVRDLVRRARRRGRVGLLTNATTRLPRDLAALGLAEDFDAIINSSAIGVAKPDPAIFAEAARMLGTPPAQTVYVDDTPTNVVAGCAVGLIGYHYTDADAFERVLRDHGILT